jgi:hypothetical protein
MLRYFCLHKGKERAPTRSKSTSSQEWNEKYFNKFFDSYYCFIFILKYFAQGNSGPLIKKFFNFAAAKL